MMAMAQQFPHPGAMPGQGMPHGHPMGPGNAHGMPPGQPGMNQMQMSMAGGPGGPQVSQAGMMGGMPQMGPGHGMNPQMAHQLAIQNAQMNGAMASMQHLNPQMRQQLMMRQQQQQQQQQQVMASQGNPGMMMSAGGQPMMMANGMQPGVTRVNLPAHLQNQIPPTGHPQANPHMAQQHQMLLQQQQQIAAAQQAAQQHMQQQQQIAMQQQASTAGPSPAPSATAQPPMRPPSQVQNRPDQPGMPSTSQPQPPQQQPTPVQQTQPPPPSQQASQQAQPQNQQVNVGQTQPSQNPQQPNQQNQPQQQQQPQQPGQQQVPTQMQQGPQGQPQIIAPQNENLAQQQRMAFMAARSRAQQPAAAMGSQGACVLTLLQLADSLSGARSENQGDEFAYWQSFVNRFFSPTGTLRQRLLNSKDKQTKDFSIAGPSLAWYYHLLYKNGVDRTELIMERAQEKDLPTSLAGHVVESPRTSFVFWYGTTHQVVSTGQLQVIFDANGKISLFDFKVEENKEFIDRSELVPDSQSPEQKSEMNSPRLSKKQQKQKSQVLQNPALRAAIERRPVGEWSIPDRYFMFLETAENFARMNHLFEHVSSNPTDSASETLKKVVQSFQQQANNQSGLDGPTGQLGPQGFPGGPPNQRTPGAGTSFASPAPNAHLALPGGSMSASPAMMNHGLPGQGGIAMAPNVSQGGSGNPSANASPSVTGNGKKRRQSQVKTEDDNEKAKASPRMVNGPNQKRMKP